jgi:hypothetical protein
MIRYHPSAGQALRSANTWKTHIGLLPEPEFPMFRAPSLPVRGSLEGIDFNDLNIYAGTRIGTPFAESERSIWLMAKNLSRAKSDQRWYHFGRAIGARR